MKDVRIFLCNLYYEFMAHGAWSGHRMCTGDL